MGTHNIRKNRYKRKKPEKKPPQGPGPGFRILLKSVIAALFIFCMSLIFIFIHDVLTQSDYFRVESITVEGCERLTREQVLEAADLHEGDNFVSLNLRNTRERLLAYPWIAAAEIVRTPSGVIAIRIKEHAPLAVIDFGKKFLVNTEGIIFKEATDAETEGLPVVIGVSYADWKSPEYSESPFFASVMELLKAAGRPDAVLTKDAIRRIVIDRDVGLIVEMNGPVRRVRLGYGEYEAKKKRLSRILAYLAADEKIPFIEELDLRDPDSIVAKPGIEEPIKGKKDKKKNQKEV